MRAAGTRRRSLSTRTNRNEAPRHPPGVVGAASGLRVGTAGHRRGVVRVNAEPMTLGFEASPRYGITRAWAMPNSETFDMPPIAAFLERWHRPPSVDPFARNSEWATYRNDLSPDTTAQTHMEAADYCALLA